MSELKAALCRFQQTCRDAVSMRKHGHTPLNESYHMLLMGNPGTGKTKVARLLFDMLKSAGVLTPLAPFIEFKASHAEGANMGEAREKVQEKIEKARGGVLFVDEAHQLTMHKDNMYGQQAASQLMDCLQDGDGADESRRVIVIYAGYVDGMQILMQSDAGYGRRIRHQFPLPDYTPSELAEIFFIKMAELKRGIGEGVTVAAVSTHIEACTSAVYRSNHNGTIAEMLFEITDEAMQDRLNAEFDATPALQQRRRFEGATLCFGAEDVEHGAEGLKAAFDAYAAAAGPATPTARTASSALTATPLAASTALATLDGSSSAAATDGDDARIKARALPQPS
tara:strand:+ start:15 stop:1031 length:1017 start_codon:yes stop_codon:yes gene_type:complete